jgi:hypothetical protein
MEEIRDCRYCNNSDAKSPDCDKCKCYADIGDYIDNPSEKAKTCHDFLFCDLFPKT